jgi:hypothetical protein
MGMGKTVEVLATALSNPAPPAGASVGTCKCPPRRPLLSPHRFSRACSPIRRRPSGACRARGGATRPSSSYHQYLWASGVTRFDPSPRG